MATHDLDRPHAAIITGGGGGLGAAIARGLAARGVAVALLDVAEEAASRVAEAIAGEYGVKTVAVRTDITDPASVAVAWERATEAIGQIDIAINNAGRFSPMPFLEMTVAEWNTTIDVNLNGAFHVSQRAARDWVEHDIPGSIVSIASIAAVTSGPAGAIDYGASKAGLIGMTVHLAVNLGPYGIRANTVSPGSFYSPMNEKRLQDPDQVAKSEAMVPLRRIGQPEEVAAAVVFLALDGTYINGVNIDADGGTVAVM